MEGFIPVNGSAGNSAPVTSLIGGKRRSHKKLRVVKKKTVRKMLKKMGLKMRGGAAGEVTADKVVTDKEAPGVVVPPAAGGKRRHTKKSHRRRSLFGMKY
jgi:hypothetical protein